MNKLLLATIALAIAFVIFMPMATFAKNSRANEKRIPVTQEVSVNVSKVEGRDGGSRHVVNTLVTTKNSVGVKRVTTNPVTVPRCTKNCVNGAKKTIAKNYHATCGKALGKKNKPATAKEAKHVCTSGCQSVCTKCTTKCTVCSHKIYGHGYGHCKKEHNYNGYGYGHVKHKCSACGGGDLSYTDKIVQTVTPTASAQSASSYSGPATLPQAGAGILFQVLAFLSTLFGVWGVRKFI